MSLLDGIRHRVRVLFRRADYERAMDEELRFHLSLDEMHGEHAGLPAADARAAARRQFGNVTRVREAHRRAAGIARLDVLRQDLAFALRSWRTRAGRGPAIVIVLTLAVGIGALTAIYSIVEAILIRPLAVRDPERLVSIQLVEPAERGARVYGGIANQDMYRAWRTQASALDGVAGFLGRYRTVTDLGPTRTTRTFEVTANLFEFLGVRPIAGRDFQSTDEAPGAARVAILSTPFAARNFGADSSVIGSVVTLDGERYAIVGVMPPGFLIPGGSNRRNPSGDIWTPITIFPDRERAAASPIDVIARLARGVGVAAAHAELDTILAATALATDPAAFGKVTQLTSPHRMMVDDVRRPLLLIGAGASVLLLIASANVANMMLAAAVKRRREIALRTALGASRSRLVRQLLTESVALCVVGGAVGVGVAFGILPVIVALAGNHLPPLGEIEIDRTVLAVSLAVTLLVGIVVGLAPVTESERGGSHVALKEGAANTTPSRWSQLTSNGLIAGEVALALLLLSAMGLVARSFIGVISLERGYDANSVLLASVGVPRELQPTDEAARAFSRRALQRLGAIPGVVSAAASNAAPLLRSRGTSFAIDGASPSSSSPWIELWSVSEGYFATLGIPLRRGRLPASDDEVVVDEAAVRALFPDGSALGRRLEWGNPRRPGTANRGRAVVVGIVGDIHEAGAPQRVTAPHVYRALSTGRAEYFAVRVERGDPARLLPAVRAVFAEIDPDITVDIADAMDNMLRARYGQEWFLTQLMLALAGIALFLATIGIYSVVSYATARRSREVGIRLALGAQRSDVVALAMRRALIPVAGGGVLGLVAIVAAGPALRAHLFELSPTDPFVLSAVMTILGTAAVVASYLPSRRATRVDPTVVLREE